MPTVGFPDVPDSQDVSVLRDYLIKHMRDTEWTLNNLDTLNINRLDAKVVKTGVLDATLVTIRSALSLGYINIDGNGMVVNNGTFNTFEVDMNGEVSLTKALIRSSTVYPYIELSPTANMLRAALQPGNEFRIEPNPSGFPSPTIFFDLLGTSTSIGHLNGSTFLLESDASTLIIKGSNAVSIQSTNLTIPSQTRLSSSLYSLGYFNMPYSTATDVEGLVSDFNNAMVALYSMGIFR